MTRPPKRPQGKEGNGRWNGGFNGGGGGNFVGGGATATYSWPRPASKPTMVPAPKIRGELTIVVTAPRSKVNRRRAGGADRRHSDDGGHFIAARFNGPSDAFNHFAQDASFNRGRYRAIEDQWANDLRRGRRVSVDIVAYYSGESKRPSSLSVEWSVDGRWQSQDFSNEPKGKSGGR